MRRLAPLAVLLSLAALAGCGLVTSLAVDLVYRDAALPAALVEADVPYLGAGDPKHRLTLFRALPDSARAHPAVVFVHGGGWTTGDRDLRVGGEDVYHNIGRFLAARGIPAATLSYRLQPGVTWREQVADVAAAVAFVQRDAAVRAARAGRPAPGVVVMGHSAGAYLATFVALDGHVQRAAGMAPVCGVVSVSGAALDLRDRETYALEDNFDYYSARFAPDRVARAEPPAVPAPWQAEASPIARVTAGAPPFLILYAGGETRALQRQSLLLDAALRAAGVRSRVVVVPGRSHTRIVPTLSRDDQTAGPAILDFVRHLDCLAPQRPERGVRTPPSGHRRR